MSIFIGGHLQYSAPEDLKKSFLRPYLKGLGFDFQEFRDKGDRHYLVLSIEGKNVATVYINYNAFVLPKPRCFDIIICRDTKEIVMKTLDRMLGLFSQLTVCSQTTEVGWRNGTLVRKTMLLGKEDAKKKLFAAYDYYFTHHYWFAKVHLSNLGQEVRFNVPITFSFDNPVSDIQIRVFTSDNDIEQDVTIGSPPKKATSWIEVKEGGKVEILFLNDERMVYSVNFVRMGKTMVRSDGLVFSTGYIPLPNPVVHSFLEEGDREIFLKGKMMLPNPGFLFAKSDKSAFRYGGIYQVIKS